MLLQHAGELGARELTALIGVEYLRRSVLRQGFFQGLDTEVRRQGVRQLLSVARPSAYLGQLARAERHAVACPTGTRRLELRGDGEALRSLLSGALGTVRRSTERASGQ